MPLLKNTTVQSYSSLNVQCTFKHMLSTYSPKVLSVLSVYSTDLKSSNLIRYAEELSNRI